MFPKGTNPIPNAWGTAPGILAERNGKLIVCLPGVPKEMMPMFGASVLPLLSERRTGRIVVTHSLHCFGGGESAIEAMLGDLTKRGRWPEVGITASEATITLRITAAGEDQRAIQLAVEKDAKFIREKLGDLVYGENEESLQSVVGRLLLRSKKTLSTAESCTGGLVGHLLTEIPGISRSYLGGVVSYSNEAKSDLIGVPPDLIAKFGAVSPEVAEAMALGCRQRFQSDLAIGITGIAGPDGGTEAKPVGLVYVSVNHQGGTKTVKYDWPGDRSSIKIRSARTALNLVRLHLQSIDV